MKVINSVGTENKTSDPLFQPKDLNKEIIRDVEKFEKDNKEMENMCKLESISDISEPRILDSLEEKEFVKKYSPFIRTKEAKEDGQELVDQIQLKKLSEKAETGSIYMKSNLSGNLESPESRQSSIQDQKSNVSVIHLEGKDKKLRPIFKDDESGDEPSSIKVSPQSVRSHVKAKVIAKRINLIEQAKLYFKKNPQESDSDSEFKSKSKKLKNHSPENL